MVYQVHEKEEGKDPGSLQLQNLCSVTVVHVVDWPTPSHCSPFLLTTASRPAKGLVDWAHREDVNWPRLGRLGSLCMGSTGQGPGQPGQL